MSTFRPLLPGTGRHLEPDHRVEIANAARSADPTAAASPLAELSARVASRTQDVDIVTEVTTHGAQRVVETVAIAVRVVASDVRSFGHGAQRSPIALGDGDRTEHLDDVGPAIRSWAAVPTIDPPSPGLYPDTPFVPRVFQVLSSVPSEARAVIDMVESWHLPLALFFQAGAVANPAGATRTQIELAAARVSILNECFYCTLAHSSMLAAAGEAESCTIDLAALSASTGTGVRDSDVIVPFVDAVIAEGDGSDVERARTNLVNRMGQVGKDQIASTVGVFAAMNRLADTFRIPFDLGQEAAEAQAALIPGSMDYAGARSWSGS